MTKDNHILGKFELTGIPPAPRGFHKLKLLSRSMQMVFYKFLLKIKELVNPRKSPLLQRKGVYQKKKLKDRIDGRNGLEGYCYNLKNTLEDEEKGIADKLSEEDKEKVEEAVKETLEWLDDNQEAEKEEFEAKQKELEQIANPIIQKVYQAGAGGAGGEP